jgi:hypothetical protein
VPHDADDRRSRLLAKKKSSPTLNTSAMRSIVGSVGKHLAARTTASPATASRQHPLPIG